MVKFITPDTFIKNTKGKQYDMDKVAGVQCVDGIKKFTYDLYGKYDFNCGSCGYAYGLWTNYGSNGVEKYFTQVPYKEAVKGDWIIWNKGSKDAPTSHVAMYVSGNSSKVNAYGQNQNGKKYFNTASISTNGILGVLRCREYTAHVMYKKGDENKEVGKINNLLAKDVKGTLFGDYTEATVKVYQGKHNLSKTGKVDFITYEKMQNEGL